MPDLIGAKGAIKEANEKLVPNVERAIDEAVENVGKELVEGIDRATVQFANVATTIVDLLRGIEEKTRDDIQGIINSLDGWTVTLDPPIVIKTIRLNKPKEER